MTDRLSTRGIEMALGELIFAALLTSAYGYITIVQPVSEAQAAAEGGTKELYCKLVDNRPQYATRETNWYHEGHEISRDEHYWMDRMDGKRILRIRNISRHEAGEYTCDLEGLEDTSNMEAYALKVIYPPSGVFISGCPETAEAGQVLNLGCELDDHGHPPVDRFLWYATPRLRTNLQSSKHIQVQLERAGQMKFTCKASSEKGEESGSCITNVHAPPVIEKTSMDIDLDNSGQWSDVTLTCVVSGHSPQVSWLNQEEPLTLYNYHTKEKMVSDDVYRYDQFEAVESALSFRVEYSTLTCDMAKHITGPYQCKATGTISGNNREVISEELHPNFLYPSTWDVNVSQVKDVKFGEQISLTCAVCSNPAPDVSTITWQHNGRDIKHLPNASTNQNGDLVIEKMERVHLGEYTCSIVDPVKLKLGLKDGLNPTFTMELVEKDPTSGIGLCTVFAILGSILFLLCISIIWLIWKRKLQFQGTFPNIGITLFGISLNPCYQPSPPTYEESIRTQPPEQSLITNDPKVVDRSKEDKYKERAKKRNDKTGDGDESYPAVRPSASNEKQNLDDEENEEEDNAMNDVLSDDQEDVEDKSNRSSQVYTAEDEVCLNTTDDALIPKDEDTAGMPTNDISKLPV